MGICDGGVSARRWVDAEVGIALRACELSNPVTVSPSTLGLPALGDPWPSHGSVAGEHPEVGDDRTSRRRFVTLRDVVDRHPLDVVPQRALQCLLEPARPHPLGVRSTRYGVAGEIAELRLQERGALARAAILHLPVEARRARRLLVEQPVDVILGLVDLADPRAAAARSRPARSAVRPATTGPFRGLPSTTPDSASLRGEGPALDRGPP